MGAAADERVAVIEAYRQIGMVLRGGGLRTLCFWACAFVLLVSSGQLSAEAPTPEAATVIVVVGAAGEESFAEPFRTWSGNWKAAAEKAKAELQVIGLDDPGETTDRDRLKKTLADAQGRTSPLWLVLIGHGTFDGKIARFNLRGPDLTPGDLSEWLRPVKRPVAVINSASASGPFLAELSGLGRVVVTSTRSGHEYNFARLGGYLAEAIADPAADLDKDEQTSLLEAWLAAAARTAEFYAGDTRLQTEHALLDDNGDKLGTPPDFFQGIRPVKGAKEGAALDGPLAARFVLVPGNREETLSPEQRTRRDEIEKTLAAMRSRRADIDESRYLEQIEPLLVELARIYAGEK